MVYSVGGAAHSVEDVKLDLGERGFERLLGFELLLVRREGIAYGGVEAGAGGDDAVLMEGEAEV